MTDLIVRTATMDDVPALLKLCEEMVPESNYAHVGFDARHFAEICMKLIVLDENDIFVTVQDKEVTGALLAGSGPGITSPAVTSYDLGFYVRPQRRSLKAAQALINAYVKWAKAKGAHRIQLGNNAGAPDVGYCKLLQRNGFTFSGSLMRMDN